MAWNAEAMTLRNLLYALGDADRLGLTAAGSLPKPPPSRGRTGAAPRWRRQGAGAPAELAVGMCLLDTSEGSPLHSELVAPWVRSSHQTQFECPATTDHLATESCVSFDAEETANRAALTLFSILPRNNRLGSSIPSTRATWAIRYAR